MSTRDDSSPHGAGIRMSIIACAAVALSLVGCSSAANDGGNTKCREFLSQDESKQDLEVSKMIKDGSGTQDDPTDLQIAAYRASALNYCSTPGNDNNKISGAPHI